MTKQELRERARALPLKPGVYIMMDKSGAVIYVGKAKALRNRVSQYFQDSAADSAKTALMVSHVDRFDVIIAESEFEALVLECSLIKRHMPKYNILLKDDKGFPFIRIDEREEYPVFSIVSRTGEDGARYFGPYGGRGTTKSAIHAVRTALKLPSCTKKFPRDINKERPCLNYHLGNCDAYCTGSPGADVYRERTEQAILLFEGKYESVAQQLREQMERAAEELRFEYAAELRDRALAIESLGKKQRVVSAAMADTDVVGYTGSGTRACFVVLHYIGGQLLDKDYELLELSGEGGEESAVSSLVKQYYLERGALPKQVLLPCPMEDSGLFSQMLREKYGRAPSFVTPQRGEKLALVRLAGRNAREEIERVTSREERVAKTTELLASMLGLKEPPRRIEAYDISNISGSDMVGSMTVFSDGQPRRKSYKRYKIKTIEGQDDYHAMREVLSRRLQRLKDGDEGFEIRPDLMLIDGGEAHAASISGLCAEFGFDIPVFGMVKDSRHRTRALVAPDGAEIGIQATPAVFALIGRIQEETHRFAIEYHRTLRSKRLKSSELDNIPGVGEARRAALLKKFRSVKAIREAGFEELCGVVPKNTAKAVFEYFRGAGAGPEEDSK